MKFIGISYNAWHGIIAFAGELFLTWFFSYWLGLWFSYLIAFGIGLLAQSLNENYQLYFTSHIPYGGTKGFIRDSKEDFIYFFAGSMLALFGVSIFYILT